MEAQGQHAPVYAYRFDWPSPFLNGALGACHALELGFTFGTYQLKGRRTLLRRRAQGRCAGGGG
ncbi:MAG: hypothetical protein WDM81_16340 [Rhizomicrobium sp.]